MIGFHFPVENCILRENISGYPLSLDVQMKKSQVVKTFSLIPLALLNAHYLRFRCLFTWGLSETNKVKSKYIKQASRSPDSHTPFLFLFAGMLLS